MREDLTHEPDVTLGRRERVEGHFGLPALRLRQDLLDRLLRQPPNVERADLKLLPARLREGEEAGNEVGHLAGFPADAVDVLFSFLFGYSLSYILAMKTADPFRALRRRLFGLAVLGLLHACHPLRLKWAGNRSRPSAGIRGKREPGRLRKGRARSCVVRQAEALRWSRMRRMTRPSVLKETAPIRP